ncbi:hypothetical protein, partial [Mesorhizobium sp.]|uniref:hypothetical protein n=1 Tax=Mesorhizobium sp. TaxID=1871066 RepID=UPI0025C73032
CCHPVGRFSGLRFDEMLACSVPCSKPEALPILFGIVKISSASESVGHNIGMARSPAGGFSVQSVFLAFP